MALIHDVIDSDVRFVIDPVRRTISNQGSGKLVLVRGDHNSERFSFEVPRYIEGHDMSLCNVVRIHYINTETRTRATISDIYEPTDLCVAKDNIHVVHFSWLISGNSTKYAGSLAFTIEFQCIVDEKIEYSWHTGINNTITIADGICNTNAIADDYSDILTSWWMRIYANATMPIEVKTIQSFAALEGSFKENTLYLLEDDPTLDEIRQIAEDRNYDKDIEDFAVKLDGVSKKLNAALTSITDMAQELSTLQSEVRLLSDRIVDLENNPGSGTGEAPSEPDSGEGEDDGEHTHSYTIKGATVAPTCETQGFTYYTCECKESIVKRDYVTALGHKYEDSVTPATCKEQGYTTHTCSACGKSYKDAYTELAAHTWSYYQDPGAGETGWSRKCSVCGEIETDVEYACTNGSEHNWEEVVVIDATCTTPAYQKYTCRVCGASKQEAIRSPLGHNYQEEVVKDATCESPAYQVYKCSRCAATYEEEIASALGHDWSDAIFDVVGAFEPTCTTPGKAAYKCSNCGEEKFESVPVLGHEYGDGVVTPPTCTEDGYTTKTCTRCGYSYVVSGSRKEALGHDWEEYSDPSASSGLSRRCRVCELVEEDI